MTLAQKNTWIAYLQHLHRNWLKLVEPKLSIGSCTAKIMKDNIIISSLLEVLYRVETYEEGQDNLNCLSDEELCKIKNKIVSLTKNCPC